MPYNTNHLTVRSSGFVLNKQQLALFKTCETTFGRAGI